MGGILLNAIDTDGITKSFDGNTKVLDSLKLKIKEGEIFGFLGPNGSGKTTAVRVFNGILKPTEGTVKILGNTVGQESQKIHTLCGVMTERASCYENLTAKENLLFYGEMHNIERKLLTDRVDYLLRRVDLYDAKDIQVKAFSTGMRKRISLAIAMVHNPKLLYLDEPTSGLDPQNIKNIMSLIKEVVKENGVTVFLCTHQLRYAQDLCTLYGFIRNGTLLGTGTFEELAAKKNAGLKVKIRGCNISKQLGFISTEKNIYEKKIANEKEINSLIWSIINHGGEIYEVQQERWDLEKLYFKYVNETKKSI